MSFLLGVCLIYIFLNWVPELLSIAIPVTNVDILTHFNGFDPELLRVMPRTPLVVYLYTVLFSGVFKLGEALFTLTYIRNRKVEYKAITEAMGLYLKALAVYLLQIVIVAFWSMLFVIPGVIASFNYSQSFYIMADDPSKGVMQILGESKMMMIGNRMSYFRLLIYYLPYLMIAYVPTFLIGEYVTVNSISGIQMTLLAMAAEIPIFFANAYMCLGRAVFYELMLNEGFAYFKYAGQDAFRELEQ